MYKPRERESTAWPSINGSADNVYGASRNHAYPRRSPPIPTKDGRTVGRIRPMPTGVFGFPFKALPFARLTMASIPPVFTSEEKEKILAAMALYRTGSDQANCVCVLREFYSEAIRELVRGLLPGLEQVPELDHWVIIGVLDFQRLFSAENTDDVWIHIDYIISKVAERIPDSAFEPDLHGMKSLPSIPRNDIGVLACLGIFHQDPKR
jgi:hypothetical protein